MEKQPRLLDVEATHEQEWRGMPEFHQEKREPYATIIVRVDDDAALQELSTLLRQKLTRKTRSIWFPFKSHWGQPQRRWISES